MLNGTDPDTIPRLYFPKLDAELNVTVTIDRMPKDFSITFHENINGFCINIIDIACRVNFRDIGFYFIPGFSYELEHVQYEAKNAYMEACYSLAL